MNIVLFLTALLVLSYAGIAVINIFPFTYRKGYEIWAACHKYTAFGMAFIAPIVLDLNSFDSVLCALLFAAISAPAITVFALAVAALSNFVHTLFIK